MNSKKRLFTGLQPSGEALHIGNYLGALKPFCELYEQYESLLCVVDYHALTTVRDPEILRKNTVNVAKDYLAAGVDPEKAIIFRQSDVPEHTELTWILSTLVTVPFLMQAHAYKDKVAKGIEPTAGLFNYPVLMASDILLYDTDIVPVGQDQRQHIEYTREIATKFNNAYTELFKKPEERIDDSVATIPGTDGRKMSKSYNNTIPLFGTDEEIQKAVMGIVTDSKGVEEAKDPEADAVFAIHKYFADDIETLAKRYRDGGIGYKESKELLAKNIIAAIAPMRERRANISDSDVEAVLAEGAKKAQAIAKTKMDEVRVVIGVRK